LEIAFSGCAAAKRCIAAPEKSAYITGIELMVDGGRAQ
jgi:hypothetical protein